MKTRGNISPGPPLEGEGISYQLQLTTLDSSNRLDLDQQPRIGEVAHFDHSAGRQVVLEEFLARRDDLFEFAHVRREHGRPHNV